jgi:predicted ATP-binding protein involved in virulence
MKIRKLHIKNYKVFNDLELDFTDANGKTLDKIVLAGVNGCGKTTILEIIYKLCNGTLRDDVKRLKNCSIEIEIELTEREGEKAIISINEIAEKNNVFLTQQERVDYFKNLFVKGNFIEGLFDLNTKASKLENIISALMIKLPNNAFNSGLYYLPFKNEQRKNIYDLNVEIIHLDADKDKMKSLILKKIGDEVFKNEDVTPRQTKEKAIKRITKALDGLTLTTKLVDLESEELIFESANGEKIKFEELSNGEQTLYFRAIYLSTLNPQNSIIMVDEPEESLHPTWQQKVMKLYQNIGENNQVIVATHSPHIIGASNADEVFLLEIDDNHIEATHPRNMRGHSIEYILEAMGTDPNNTAVINLVDSYLALMRKGMHETSEGLKVKAAIDALELDPNSEEMRRLDLSLRRFKVIGV